MNKLNNIRQTLFEMKLQSILTDIVCLTLENKQNLIINQIETKLNDFKINDKIICESESKIDQFERTLFNLNLKSFNNKYIAKLEIYISENGVYREGSFDMVDPEYVNTNLINILQLHKLGIAKNLFKYPKIWTNFPMSKLK